MLRISLCAVALLAACAAHPPVAAPPDIVLVEPGKTQERAERLGLLRQLHAAVADAAANASANERGDLRSAAGANLLELQGVLQSKVGDVDGAISSFDLRNSKRRLPPQPTISQEALDGLRVEDAIQAIVAEARHRRVVLINEAHHVPLHRAFTLRLARELRKIGYSDFAAETLTRDGAGMQGTPVSQGDGAYIEEPNYAELIRQVGREGWRVVAYDSFEPPPGSFTPLQRLQHRETTQANNLVEKVLKPHPDAKLLVHVGFGHGHKTATGSGFKLMGAMLRELGGVDPLSIDQTSLFAHPEPTMESPSYRATVTAKAIRAPAVLRKADGSYFVFGMPTGAVDMQVIHPPYGVIDGRPEWLVSLAGRTPTDIPRALLPTTKPRLIYAFHREDERLDALPADIVLVQPDTKPPKLMLPPGNFRLEFEE